MRNDTFNFMLISIILIISILLCCFLICTIRCYLEYREDRKNTINTIQNLSAANYPINGIIIGQNQPDEIIEQNQLDENIIINFRLNCIESEPEPELEPEP